MVRRPAKPEPFPVTATRYPSFWRTPAWRPWRPLVAIVVALVIFFVLQVVALLASLIVDVATGRTTLEKFSADMSVGKLTATPAFFLANNISLGVLIPVSGLLALWFFRQRPGWLSSVVGRLRWRWLLVVTAAILPIWLALLGLQLAGTWDTLHVNADTVVLIIGIVVTTPFQAAGEEYAFRGLLNRAVGSFFARPVLALVIGGLVSSGVFMLAHSAADPWLNVFYFLFGAVASWLTWRTGGLEAAIAVHVVNNMVNEATMPFSDISGMFDRSAGAMSAIHLVPVIVPLALAVAVVELLVRFTRVGRQVAAVGPPRPGPSPSRQP